MKNTIILILSLLVIGLSSYVIFDKVISKDKSDTKSNNTEVIDIKIDSAKDNYTYESIEGTYVLNNDVELKDKYVFNENITIDKGILKSGTELFLFKNGTFRYISDIVQIVNGMEAHSGEDIIGNYTINGNIVTLNYWFAKKESPNYSSITKSVSIKINNNNIEDSNIGNITYTLEKIDTIKDTSFIELPGKRYVIEEIELNQYLNKMNQN